VRATLRILEQKGHVRHEEDGRAYVFIPVIRKDAARKGALAHLVRPSSTIPPSRPSRRWWISPDPGKRCRAGSDCKIIDDAKRKDDELAHDPAPD
jgi:hypothetical protein